MNETQELILNAIGELARLCPQQRIGQIIYNYILTECPNEDPFFIPDDKMLKILESKLKIFANSSINTIDKQ